MIHLLLAETELDAKSIAMLFLPIIAAAAIAGGIVAIFRRKTRSSNLSPVGAAATVAVALALSFLANRFLSTLIVSEIGSRVAIAWKALALVCGVGLMVMFVCSLRLGPGRAATSREKAAWYLPPLLIILGTQLALWYPVYKLAVGQDHVAYCLSNLRQIGLAINMYHNDHNAFPTSLDEISEYIGNSAKLEHCAENGKSYDYRRPTVPYSDETIIVFDPMPHETARHPGRAVVRLNGVATFLKEEDFQRELQQMNQPAGK